MIAFKISIWIVHVQVKSADLKFSLSGRSNQASKHTPACAQWSHASVGLAQARPKYIATTPTVYSFRHGFYYNRVLEDSKSSNSPITLHKWTRKFSIYALQLTSLSSNSVITFLMATILFLEIHRPLYTVPNPPLPTISVMFRSENSMSVRLNFCKLLPIISDTIHVVHFQFRHCNMCCNVLSLIRTTHSQSPLRAFKIPWKLGLACSTSRHEKINDTNSFIFLVSIHARLTIKVAYKLAGGVHISTYKASCKLLLYMYSS